MCQLQLPAFTGWHLARTPFNAVVPFYANVNDTPAAYRETGDKFDVTKMYWLSNLLATFGDYDFSLFKDQEDVLNKNSRRLPALAAHN